MDPHRAVLLITLLLLPGAAAEGQLPPPPGSKHSLGYSLGFQQSREELLMPKVHRGALHIFSYQYEDISDRYRMFRFNLGFGKLKTVIEDDPATIHGGVWLRYRHAFNLLRRGDVLLYVGPTASVTSSISYYDSWDESHVYWADCLSLGPSGVLCVPDRDNLWLTSLDLSLFGLFTRPDPVRLNAEEDWSLADVLRLINRHYRLGSFSDAGQLDVNTEYRSTLTRGGYLAFSYAFQWSRIRAPDGRPLTEMLHRVGIRVSL
jgi:hypothetical protein